MIPVRPSLNSTCLLAAALLLGSSLAAQTPSLPVAAKQAASDAVNARLSLTHLRRLRCASPTFANCPGNLQVVRDVALVPQIVRGDTVWFQLRWEVMGYVASSEASLMFIPDRDTFVDSATVAVIRRGARWLVDSTRFMSESSQTSVAAARQFFRFEADDRRSLDSVVKTRRAFQRAPNEP